MALKQHQWDRIAGPTFCDSPWGHGTQCGEPLIGARCMDCGAENRAGGPKCPPCRETRARSTPEEISLAQLRASRWSYPMADQLIRGR